jgi:hypothetical protein
VPVLPADAEARRFLTQNLLDHSRPAWLRGSLRLDDDPVANMNAHLRHALPRLGTAVRWKEVSATSRTSPAGRDGRCWRCKRGVHSREVRFAGVSGVIVGVLVAASLWATSASGSASACKPTASDGFGPWARAVRAAPRRAVFGSGFTLSGTVLHAGDCKPVKGAVVEVWQETPGVGYVRRGRASVLTDATGAFRIIGPVPRAEGGFAGHIHIRVTHSLFQELAITHFVGHGSHHADLTLVLTDSQL